MWLINFLHFLVVFLLYLIAVSIYFINMKNSDPKRQKATRTIGWIMLVFSVLVLIPVVGNIALTNERFRKTAFGGLITLELESGD
jgi:uncharacterized membrane protein